MSEPSSDILSALARSEALADQLESILADEAQPDPQQVYDLFAIAEAATNIPREHLVALATAGPSSVIDRIRIIADRLEQISATIHQRYPTTEG